MTADSSRDETRRLLAISEAMTVFLDRGDVAAASQPLLAGAFDLTGSEYGFVGALVEGPVLRVLAHGGLVWHQTENRAFYEQALSRYREVGYLEFHNFETLFGRVLTTGRPLLANAAGRHPAAGGLPPGHPPLHHFLGVPVLWGDAVVGMLAVANRPGGYGEAEQRNLEALADAAGALMDSYRRVERHAAVEAERRVAEAALRESNRRLEAALKDLESAQQQLVRDERLRALGLMASGIAHDFNNSLQGILGFADYLLADPLDDRQEVWECLRLIRTAACDASGVVRRMGVFAGQVDADAPRQAIDLETLIAEVVALTRPRWHDESLARGGPIEVHVHLESAPGLRGDARGLRDAFTNLVFNAVDAMPQGGALTLRSRLDADHVSIEVVDTGVGMSAEVRERCLEPFFSTKETPRTGMGLAMVWGVIERHAGEVEIDSAPGRGTCVRLRLPLTSPLELEAPSVPPPVAAGSRPRELRILIADDEAAVRDSLARLLQRDGHAVTAVCDGREAFDRIARSRGAEFHLAIIDHAMPGMTGSELARVLASRRIELPLLLLSGYAATLRGEIGGDAGVRAVLQKPIGAPALRDAIGAAVSWEPAASPAASRSEAAAAY